MKKLIDAFMIWAEALGKARAAATLTRMGKYDEAKKLMLIE